MKSCIKYIFLLFAFCFLHITDGVLNRCDYKYCSLANAWFKYHVAVATWHDARLICAMEGTILASPTTPEIMATMTKFTKDIPIFTGYHATASKGFYYTIDGKPLEESHHRGWITADEPEYHKGGCLAMDSEGFFFNADCYKPRPYMCYTDRPLQTNDCGNANWEYKFDGRTNKCYKFHSIPRNFSRANLACSAEGGHLAIINSQLEAKVLKDLFVKYKHGDMLGNFWKDVAFVGMYDWGEHGDWRTVHGQTIWEAGYWDFAPGEPNNSTTGEYCGSIYRTGKLNDLWCDGRYAFICEKDPNYPPLCDSEAVTQSS